MHSYEMVMCRVIRLPNRIEIEVTDVLEYLLHAHAPLSIQNQANFPWPPQLRHVTWHFRFIKARGRLKSWLIHDTGLQLHSRPLFSLFQASKSMPNGHQIRTSCLRESERV